MPESPKKYTLLKPFQHSSLAFGESCAWIFGLKALGGEREGRRWRKGEGISREGFKSRGGRGGGRGGFVLLRSLVRNVWKCRRGMCFLEDGERRNIPSPPLSQPVCGFLEFGLSLFLSKTPFLFLHFQETMPFFSFSSQTSLRRRRGGGLLSFQRFWSN